MCSLQVLQEKWQDIHEELRVNHNFLSYFVSAGTLEIKHVDQIMRVRQITRRQVYIKMIKYRFIATHPARVPQYRHWTSQLCRFCYSFTLSQITRLGLWISNNVSHDNVIKWNHFPRYFGGEFTGPGPGEFPAQNPMTRSFGVFFDLRLNKRLSKQPRGW